MEMQGGVKMTEQVPPSSGAARLLPLDGTTGDDTWAPMGWHYRDARSVSRLAVSRSERRLQDQEVEAIFLTEDGKFL